MVVLLINPCKGERRMALTRALTTGGGDEDGWGADGFVTTMKDLLSKEQRFFIKLSSIDHKKEKRLSLVETDAMR